MHSAESVNREATAEEITRDIVVAIIGRSNSFNPNVVSQNNSRRQIEASGEAYKRIHAVVKECGISKVVPADDAVASKPD